MTNRRTASFAEIQKPGHSCAFEVARMTPAAVLQRMRKMVEASVALCADADPASAFGGALALNAEGKGAPEWIEVLPKGPDLLGRDGRRWRMSDASKVVAAFAANAAHLPIDIEHSQFIAAPKGEPAPASGWIEAVEVRGGAVYARVSWTPKGAETVANREYRYISPVFTFDPETKEVLALKGAGLVNRPNLELPALNNEGENNKGTAPMWKKLLAALGLTETATEDDAVAAVAAMRAEKETALNQAKSPPLSLFIPRADYDAALNRASEAVTALDAFKANARTAEIEVVVGDAVAKGQIVPATKDYHIAACRSDEGLKAFKEMIAKVALNPAAQESGLDHKKPGATGVALNAEEQAVCKQLGMSAETFIKQRDATSL